MMNAGERHVLVRQSMLVNIIRIKIGRCLGEAFPVEWKRGQWSGASLFTSKLLH